MNTDKGLKNPCPSVVKKLTQLDYNSGDSSTDKHAEKLNHDMQFRDTTLPARMGSVS